MKFSFLFARPLHIFNPQSKSFHSKHFSFVVENRLDQNSLQIRPTKTNREVTTDFGERPSECGGIYKFYTNRIFFKFRIALSYSETGTGLCTDLNRSGGWINTLYQSISIPWINQYRYPRSINIITLDQSISIP